MMMPRIVSISYRSEARCAAQGTRWGNTVTPGPAATGTECQCPKLPAFNLKFNAPGSLHPSRRPEGSWRATTAGGGCLGQSTGSFLLKLRAFRRLKSR